MFKVTTVSAGEPRLVERVTTFSGISASQ